MSENFPKLDIPLGAPTGLRVQVRNNWVTISHDNRETSSAKSPKLIMDRFPSTTLCSYSFLYKLSRTWKPVCQSPKPLNPKPYEP